YSPQPSAERDADLQRRLRKTAIQACSNDAAARGLFRPGLADACFYAVRGVFRRYLPDTDIRASRRDGYILDRGGPARGRSPVVRPCSWLDELSRSMDERRLCRIFDLSLCPVHKEGTDKVHPVLGGPPGT